MLYKTRAIAEVLGIKTCSVRTRAIIRGIPPENIKKGLYTLEQVKLIMEPRSGRRGANADDLRKALEREVIKEV